MLLRVKHHTAGKQFHFSEQLNLQTGFEQGANDLTWSYGTLISAMAARREAVEAASETL